MTGFGLVAPRVCGMQQEAGWFYTAPLLHKPTGTECHPITVSREARLACMRQPAKYLGTFQSGQQLLLPHGAFSH